MRVRVLLHLIVTALVCGLVLFSPSIARAEPTLAARGSSCVFAWEGQEFASNLIVDDNWTGTLHYKCYYSYEEPFITTNGSARYGWQPSYTGPSTSGRFLTFHTNGSEANIFAFDTSATSGFRIDSWTWTQNVGGYQAGEVDVFRGTGISKTLTAGCGRRGFISNGDVPYHMYNGHYASPDFTDEVVSGCTVPWSEFASTDPLYRYGDVFSEAPPVCMVPDSEPWTVDDVRPVVDAGIGVSVLAPGSSWDVSVPFGTDVGQVWARFRGGAWQQLSPAILDPDAQEGTLTVSPLGPARNLWDIEFRCLVLPESQVYAYSYYEGEAQTVDAGWTPFHATNLSRPCRDVYVFDVDGPPEWSGSGAYLPASETVTFGVRSRSSTNVATIYGLWESPTPLPDFAGPEIIRENFGTPSLASGVSYLAEVGPYSANMAARYFSLHCEDRHGSVLIWSGAVMGTVPVHGGDGSDPDDVSRFEECFDTAGWSLTSPSTWVTGGIRISACLAGVLVVPDDGFFSDFFGDLVVEVEDRPPFSFFVIAVEFVQDVGDSMGSPSGHDCVDLSNEITPDTEVCLSAAAESGLSSGQRTWLAGMMVAPVVLNAVGYVVSLVHERKAPKQLTLF